ncbi:MAG: ribosomal RNA small subunit methyltransferase A [Nitrospiraceae bacterium]|nr:ribosomal RNA small subunit methyltransferase A [Nitrospiraceae bacterium]
MIKESALDFIKQEILPEKNKNYIEVGAGFLFLTNIIARSGGKVFAIEKDKRFTDFYKDARYDNVDIILEDALNVDFSALDANELFGNIPYNISTNLLLKIIKTENIERAVLLLQKEFAMRILSDKNHKTYSSITVLADFFFEKHFLKTFPPHFFYPKPRVSSTLIELTKKEVNKEIDQGLFFKIVRAAFSQRRKKILNSLSTGFNRENMERALNPCGNTIQYTRREFIGGRLYKTL